MSITLTSNWTETLQPETVAYIKSLEELDFEFTAMLAFIDEHNEADFREYYGQYVTLGEGYGYEAVDAFLTLYDCDDLVNFPSAYIGCFADEERMAEEYYDGELNQLPFGLVVDWSETADFLLMHDVDQVGNEYFRTF